MSGNYIDAFSAPNRVNTNLKCVFLEFKGNPLPPLMPDYDQYQEMKKGGVLGDITRIFWLPEFKPIPTYKHPDIDGDFY